MSKSSKNVQFSKDSDTSGSRTSSHGSSHASHKSSRGHRRSDSESLSDYDSRTSVPEGAFSSAEYAQQRLREALKSACTERDQWKNKARDIDQQLVARNKEFHQLDAQWRGLIERNNIIEGEKNKLFTEKKALQEFNNSLQDENADLKQRLERLEKKLNRASSGPPPSMTVPILNSPDKPPKLHRSNSRSHRASEDEQAAAKEKARLSQRFERSDESSDGRRSDNTSKSERERRHRRQSVSTTYIEPMGPPAARPGVPPSPTRRFTTYTTSPPFAPQYSNVTSPVMASVPRSVNSSRHHHGSSSSSAIHPSVLVQTPRYDESPFHPDEDGSYFAHPLPRDRDRGR